MSAPARLLGPRPSTPLAVAQAVVLVVLLTVGLISIARDDAPSDSLSVVDLRNVASAARDQGSALMDMDITIEAGGRELSITGSGSASFTDETSEFTLDFGELGAAVGFDELVLVGQGERVWIQVPEAKVAANGGRHWVSAPAPTTTGSADLLGDPTSFLDYFSALSDDVEVVGSETVRGVETTHYRASVSVAKMLDAVPADQRDLARSALEASGLESIPVDAYVDADGLVRRTASTVEIGGQAKVVTRYDVYDYGTDVDIEVPAASDTTAVDDLAGAYAVLGLPFAGLAA